MSHRAQAFAELLARPDIRRATDLAHVTKPSVGTGFTALDIELPGGGWPSAHERLEKLEEATDIIRRLLDGEHVNHHGPHFDVVDAKLWDVPERPVPIGIAVSVPVTISVSIAVSVPRISIAIPRLSFGGLAARIRPLATNQANAGTQQDGPKSRHVHECRERGRSIIRRRRICW